MYSNIDKKVKLSINLAGFIFFVMFSVITIAYHI